MEEWNEMKGDGVDCGAESDWIASSYSKHGSLLFSGIFRSSIHVGLILSKKIDIILM